MEFEKTTSIYKFFTLVVGACTLVCVFFQTLILNKQTIILKQQAELYDWQMDRLACDLTAEIVEIDSKVYLRINNTGKDELRICDIQVGNDFREPYIINKHLLFKEKEFSGDTIRMNNGRVFCSLPSGSSVKFETKASSSTTQESSQLYSHPAIRVNVYYEWHDGEKYSYDEEFGHPHIDKRIDFPKAMYFPQEYVEWSQSQTSKKSSVKQ